MYVCIKCNKGLMDPVSKLDQPDPMDRFQCSFCGHQANIHPFMISITQLATSIVGIGFSLYLLIHHLLDAVKAIQLSNAGASSSHFALVLLGCFFVAGFVYTILKAWRNLRTLRLYRRKANTG
ncbi:MAG: hypothetical protein CL581_01030 [Alteromonadaceae bacterium]|uniref:hypothetical protein n=1 Tax=unclassified Marinobacter TaxID=83889 RepID=UPI000C51FFCD|nr:hypothetical protein [Marinobacter sp. BGYM27]MAA63354.1 hypothetical protein [Alteromonadaceae bacterium]MBH85634.1 hypothetical protein [Alteromonadaceae bacterium]MDG5500475.1 hypothetical protein [Marinobacter sp. BGYM27]|tara:strand:+ start:813 stop:1181 length:369 start_codon:yes stop_codon:yes gene_type:complete